MTQHIIDTDELEPCPFCGSHNISTGEVAGNHLDGTYFVQTACMNCGALSPEAKTDTESVELWNRRKANSPQVDGMANSRDMFEQFATLHNMPVLKVGEAYSNDETNYAWWIWQKALSNTPQADGMVLEKVMHTLKCYRGEIAVNGKRPNDLRETDEVIAMLSAYKPQAEHIGDVNEMKAVDVLEQAAQAIDALASSGENKDDWTITRDLAFHRASEAVRALIVKPQADDVRKDADTIALETAGIIMDIIVDSFNKPPVQIKAKIQVAVREAIDKARE